MVQRQSKQEAIDDDEFKCMDEGPMKKIIGCITTIIWNEGENVKLNFTQMVLIQSLKDELNKPEDQASSIPVKQGKILTMKKHKAPMLLPVRATMYLSGIGNLIHMIRF